MNVTNSTCYTNPNAPKAEMGFDKWLYAAYVCILFSYVNVNILVFRFWLIMGAVFFVCWALDPVRAIQLDSLMFNLAFIVINIIMCIPLVRQIWPVKLTSDEERIFNRDFQSNMNIRQFKRLIKEFERKNFNLDKSQLCVIGSDFKHLVYISDIYPGWKVSIYDKDGVKLQELEEGSWLGTIEYVNYEKNKTANIYWDVTCVLEEITQFQDPYQQTEQNLIPGTGCDVYFFDLKTLVKRYNDSVYPMFYKNALQAIWLDYTTKYVIKQDTNLIENYYENKLVNRVIGHHDHQDEIHQSKHNESHVQRR